MILLKVVLNTKNQIIHLSIIWFLLDNHVHMPWIYQIPGEVNKSIYREQKKWWSSN
jgi:hypothetical protein